jgi:cation transport ATPase
MPSNDEIAERLMKRRANILFVLSLIFVVMQGSYIGSDTAPGTLRISAWIVMVIALLVIFATGGGLARSPAIRALMNDESTRSHRAKATTIAFYNMIASGILVYGLAMIKPVTGGEAAHLIMTVGIASALMAFWGLERAALRGGGAR